MTRLSILAGTAGLVLLLTGCIFNDRSDDYRRAGSIKEIEVPPEFNAAQLESLYPIPEFRQRLDSFYDMETDGFDIPRPEPKSAEGENSKVKIQRVGERRWIIAEASTAQVWPLTQSFLSRYGIGVSESAPAAGMIETDWVRFKVDSETKSKYRIQIEQGVKPETSEIHVLQQQVPESASSIDQWSVPSDDPEREAWLLDELANSLVLEVDNRAASLLGQDVGGRAKTELFLDGAEPTLRLRLESSRAWATLAHALNEENFKLWDEDSSSGVFYTHFFFPESQRNWFMRLFLGRKDKDSLERPYPLSEVKEHLADTDGARQLFGDVSGAAYGPPLENGAGYLVRIYPGEDGMLVKIRDHRGRRLELPVNKRLLVEIRRNLI